MSITRIRSIVAVAAIALLSFGADFAWAHCDGLDGPVVGAARKALETGNVNYALIWVGPKDEAELRSAFRQTLAVRKLGPEARELADRQLFETLVRLHRTGEGAPYTGLAPAGRDLGPAIPAADRSIASGNADAVEAMLVAELKRDLRESFERVQAHRRYDPNDVAAGREYVASYVEYIHFVERLHLAITSRAPGHFEEVAEH